MNLPIPNESRLLSDRNDSGKKVLINSVGGFFKDEVGTVVFGPYEYPYSYLVKLKEDKAKKKGEKKWKEVSGTSQPWYYVYVDRWKRCFSFVDKEIELRD